MSAICARLSKGKGRFTRGWKPQVSTLLCARAASAHSPLRFSGKLPAPPVGGNAKAHSYQRHQRSDPQLYFNREPKAPACTARRRAGIRPAAFHRNRNAADPAGCRSHPPRTRSCGRTAQVHFLKKTINHYRRAGCPAASIETIVKFPKEGT